MFNEIEIEWNEKKIVCNVGKVNYVFVIFDEICELFEGGYEIVDIV